MRNTFQKNAAVLLLAVLLLMQAACGGGGNIVEDTVQDLVGRYITGDVTGKTGKEYDTQWFSFTVESIKAVDEYAGYTADEGNQLYDVVVTETGTTAGQVLPMGTFDWVMDETSWPEYVWPLDPIEGRDEMMPLEFDLANGESVTYHMVFDVPVTASGLNLIYREIDTEDTVHLTFTISVT